jgi:transcriptional regulator with XRE-family HTH domain
MGAVRPSRHAHCAHRHLTQAEVAERIGQPQSFIAKVEGGERSLDVVEFVAVSTVVGLDLTKALEAAAAELSASHDQA